jgi:hypothetical protein
MENEKSTTDYTDNTDTEEKKQYFLTVLSV